MFGSRINPPSTVKGDCDLLKSKTTRGELGTAIAKIVLAYSPKDLQRLKWNFSEKIQNIDPVYKKRLEETITGYLQGTYQSVRLMMQQGTFSSMPETVPDDAKVFWNMVAMQCTKVMVKIRSAS